MIPWFIMRAGVWPGTSSTYQPLISVSTELPETCGRQTSVPAAREMEILEWEKRDKSGGIDRSSTSLEGQGWKGTVDRPGP
ncbi:hypothetical protein CGCVW01_v005507 [Colletotrichum viniferum]|nr:hypothetical protein CGCVW01_v005507 [Colletotrichum viniferum]